MNSIVSWSGQSQGVAAENKGNVRSKQSFSRYDRSDGYSHYPLPIKVAQTDWRLPKTANVLKRGGSHTVWTNHLMNFFGGHTLCRWTGIDASPATSLAS